MSDILIICEQQGGKIKKYSKELAYKASTLAGALGSSVQAIVFGSEAKDDAAALGTFGVKKVTVINNDAYNKFNCDPYLAAAAKVVDEIKPAYIFASATPMGRDLMPRLAVKYNGGMATECVEFTAEGGDIIFRRPVYGGKAWTDLKINSSMKFATARPNIFPVGEAKSETAEVALQDIPPAESKVLLKGTKESEAKQVDLVEADVIVSGGRAIGSGENFKILNELAAVLKASVGASRAAVDAGYIGHDQQVGQTGKTVNPTLYVACGISGAIQHLAGMRTSKIIVAINKDPDAPIFSKADFGIVGDLFKVVPAITEKLKKTLSE